MIRRQKGRTAPILTASAAALLLATPLPVAPSASAAIDSEANDTPNPAWGTARMSSELDLELIDAAPIHTGDTFNARIRVHNPTGQVIEDLHVNPRRGGAAESTEQARSELTFGAFPFYGRSVEVGTLEPGETREIDVEVPTNISEEFTLGIEDPGVYPMMFTLTGSRDGDSNSFADERFLLEVLGNNATPDDAENLTLIYPITADLDIVPGETGDEELILSSDNLAAELSPGGRLDILLHEYLDHDLKGAGCVALDPGLVDTVHRMADGYTVHDTRPPIGRPPQRLRDSWTNSEEDYRGEPGTGSAAAAEWIANLKQLDCVMTMPWANTDASAIAKTRNEWMRHEAVSRGAETIERITGNPVTTNLVAVGSGYVSEDLQEPALVADNSIWAGQAATFDASLGTLLAQSGPKPQTTGYSDPSLRYDYRMDSQRARALTAAAAINVAVGEQESVAKLPNYLGPLTAASVLDTAQRLLDENQARARSVTDLPLEPAPEGTPGSPYEDPAELNPPDVVQVQQLAAYTDELTGMMVNDPAISLTRYGFTLPLRRNLLTAVSLNDRGTRGGYDVAVREQHERLDEHGTTLRELRDSVSLIPPGNVYTRVSDSSPLLIVAKNGLPLPVEATMLYDAPDDTRLNTPSTVRIPAKGSITVSMTADIPSGARRSDIGLWLATPERQAISEPITIGVQTRAGIVSTYGIGILAGLALILALLFRLGKQKKNRRQR